MTDDSNFEKQVVENWYASLLIDPKHPELHMWAESDHLPLLDGKQKTIGQVTDVSRTEDGGLKISVRIDDEEMQEKLRKDWVRHFSISRMHPNEQPK